MKREKENQDREKTKTGPEADRLELEGNWKDQLKRALEKKKPPDGWPTFEKDKKNPKG